MKAAGTIQDAITTILRGTDKALTPEEIYQAIVARALYMFKADDPVHVVGNALRRRCVGLNFPSSHRQKTFRRVEGAGRIAYELLAQPVTEEPTVFKIKPHGRKRGTYVTVPGEYGNSAKNETEHTEIQIRLLDLGTRLGLKTWAPFPDRRKKWKNRAVGDVNSLIDQIPGQFSPAANKIVSYIDVIWFDPKGNAITAAFEIEHSTPVYSGLLRMSDLMSLQPNARIDWFLVAPADRWEKFAYEIGRPTFCGLHQPLYKCCGFLAYEKLREHLRDAEKFLDYLKPAMLNSIASRWDPEAK